MTSTPALPSYQEVTDTLAKASSNFDAAQVHGLLCGLICVTPDEDKDDSWKKLILNQAQSNQNLSILDDLYEMSHHLLTDFSFEFSLLLPEDTKNINDRTEALGLWVQGFLSGLEHHHSMIAKHGSEDVKEALNDLIEIAQVSYGDIAGNDEDESSYYELVEYVRLNALMIFQDLRTEDGADDRSIQ